MSAEIVITASDFERAVNTIAEELNGDDIINNSCGEDSEWLTNSGYREIVRNTMASWVGRHKKELSDFDIITTGRGYSYDDTIGKIEWGVRILRRTSQSGHKKDFGLLQLCGQPRLFEAVSDIMARLCDNQQLIKQFREQYGDQTTVSVK